jgi:prepilin-type N-terminal cleavage/methylation domain-containing protein
MFSEGNPSMKKLIWRARRRGTFVSGFTLLELLVVIIIIGILFAISAVGWDAITSRDRVNSVREQVTQVLRQAQTDARRSNIPRVVVFDTPANSPPRVAVLPQRFDTVTGQLVNIPIPIASIGNWQTLGNGNINPGSLEFRTFPAGAGGQVLFDNTGAIADPSARRAGVINPANPRIFSVNINQKNTTAQATRCVVVSTLLGGLRQAEGNNCPTS